MAPFPEEVDVFTEPHSRMKQLVEVSYQKLHLTDFSNDEALKSLLHSLHNTFCEFKTHEQIENKLIMKKLKNKLKALSIHDAAVCNCHNDSQLSDMLALVKDGYSCSYKSHVEKINYGLKLQRALEEFNKEFIPHMQEEEEVFQPMLMKYFGYDELKSLKDLVLREHTKWQTLVLDEKQDIKSEEKPEQSKTNHFEFVPPEVLLHIFSFLTPKDLVNCSGVCHSWNIEAYNKKLWSSLSPVYWSKGCWSDNEKICYLEGNKPTLHSSLPPSNLSDEDADFDEAESYQEWEFHDEKGITIPPCRYTEVQKERELLNALVQHVLPKVGLGVKNIYLAGCGGLSNSLFRSIIKLCPNVIWLDVSDTDINDFAFKGISAFNVCQKIKHFNLNGCQVSDEGLKLFAKCFSVGHHPARSLGFDGSCKVNIKERFSSPLSIRCAVKQSACCKSVLCKSCPFKTNGTKACLEYLSLSGCYRITDNGLRYLADSGLFAKLKFLDLSGCWQLTGLNLKDIVSSSPELSPENLYYCDEIEGGPYETEANGCQNLGTDDRPCCRKNL